MFNLFDYEKSSIKTALKVVHLTLKIDTSIDFSTTNKTTRLSRKPILFFIKHNLEGLYFKELSDLPEHLN